jgi:hypothetical protein
VELILRKSSSDDPDSTTPGEIQIAAALDRSGQRRKLALLVLEQGVSAFLSDEQDRIDRIVLPEEPTLDDMLAATMIQHLVSGRPLPQGIKPFAQYAALLREGLRPADIPLEVAIEGIFLAIRNASGEDLTAPDSSERFLEGWSRMSARILQAAEAGTDPFAQPLFDDDPDFARERAFLNRDREVYRSDIARGERWLVSLPGGPPVGSALLLRRPRSILCKFWSRYDSESPTGEAYQLLVVCWENGNWIFSTDPVQRLSLKPLAEQLQEAEQAANPEEASADPWFDGEPFDHTLVAAPRSGSSLGEKDIQRIVKRWTRARSADSLPRRWLIPALISTAALLLIAVSAVMVGNLSRRDAGPNGPATGSTSGDMDSQDWERGLNRLGAPSQPGTTGRHMMVAVGIDEYQYWPRLRNAVSDARQITELLCQRYGFATVCDPLLDEKATKEAIELLVEDQLRRELKSDDNLVFYFAGHGTTRTDQVGDEKVETGYLVPVEGQVGAEERWSKYVELDSLLKELGKLPARHVLVILDSCHSGIALGASVMSYRSNDRYKADLARRVSRMVITSARGDQVAQDGGPVSGHSLFAGTLIRSLEEFESDLDRNTILTSSELGLFLQQKVGQWSQSRQTPDYGTFYGDQRGQMVLAVREVATP